MIRALVDCDLGKFAEAFLLLTVQVRVHDLTLVLAAR
jgi:hypothetical protein